MRSADTNATDEEKSLAWDLSAEVRDYLAAHGWPEPLVADSGNGYHADYPTDLPADEPTTALVKAFLEALSARFRTAKCKVDTVVFDLPRLVKAYGSLEFKCENTKDRPHRFSRMLSVPASRGCVTAEMLRDVVEELSPTPVKAEPRHGWTVPETNGSSAETRARAYVFTPGFPDSVSGQNGHGRLFSVASILVDGFGLGRSEAMPIFRDWNAAKAQPPESDRQLEHKLDDAIKKSPLPSLKILNAERKDSNGRAGNGAATQTGDPPPDQSPPEPEPWQPLRLGELPPVPEFPLDVLPAPVERLVVEAAASVGCDPGMVAGHIIATAGGLIGRSASLLQGSNRFDHATVNLAVISPPGDGKSPALDYATEPVREFDTTLAETFAKEKQRYESELEEYTSAGKKDRGPKPTPPVPGRICIDDTTLEAVFRVLAAHPRGLLMIRDEMSALVLSLNQYKNGGGSDRPNLLKIWSCKSVLIDRVLNENGEPIRIPFPFMCITGNLPPAMLWACAEITFTN